MAAIVAARPLAGRNLLLYRRDPRHLVSAAVAPVVFLLGFSAVMSRTMDAQGIDYAQFLPPAIVVQAMLFAAMGSGFSLAADVQSGLVRRLRSLPVPPLTVLVARAAGDAARAVLSVVVLLAVAHVLGFRFQAGALAAVGFLLVAIAFALVVAAGCGAVGLSKGDPEATGAVLIVPYLPLLMISTGFVPVEAFPGWLEPLVEWSPVSAAIDLLRALSSGGALVDPFLRWLGWSMVLVVLFGVLGTRAMRRAA